MIKKILQEYKLPELLEKQLGKDYGLFLDQIKVPRLDLQEYNKYLY